MQNIYMCNVQYVNEYAQYAYQQNIPENMQENLQNNMLNNMQNMSENTKAKANIYIRYQTFAKFL